MFNDDDAAIAHAVLGSLLKRQHREAGPVWSLARPPELSRLICQATAAWASVGCLVALFSQSTDLSCIDPVTTSTYSLWWVVECCGEVTHGGYTAEYASPRSLWWAAEQLMAEAIEEAPPAGHRVPQAAFATAYRCGVDLVAELREARLASAAWNASTLAQRTRACVAS